jgi:hypothetical protein
VTNTTTITNNAGVYTPPRGRNYTVNVNPVANQFGTNLITIWATNSYNQVASASFVASSTKWCLAHDRPIADTNIMAGTF